MNPIVKLPILTAIIGLAVYGLWVAIKGSIAKRPDKKQATMVYAMWLVLMVVGMVTIHPAMLLLPLAVLAPGYFAGGLFSGLIAEPRPGEGGVRLFLEDIYDMGINALFTGVFLSIVYFVAYAFYPEYLG